MSEELNADTWKNDKWKLALTVINMLAMLALSTTAWVGSSLVGKLDQVARDIQSVDSRVTSLDTKVQLLSKDFDSVASVKKMLEEHMADKHPTSVLANVKVVETSLKELKEGFREHTHLDGHPVTIERIAQLRAALDHIERTRFTTKDGELLEKRLEKLEGK